MQNWLALVTVSSFALGVTFALFFHPTTALTALVFLFSIVFLGAWFFGRRDLYLLPALALLFLSLGIARVPLHDSGIRSALESSLDVKQTYSGVITAFPDTRENTVRLTVHLEQEDVAILVVAPRYPQFSYGDKVTVSGKVEHPEPFETDGGRTFRYDMFLAKDHVAYLMNFASVEKVGESQSPLVTSVRMLYKVRGVFAQGLQNALPEPSASLAEGILVGGKQGLGKSLLEAFTVSGLLPIVVLSGYNVMIVAMFVLACFSFLRRRYALILSGITIALFVLMAGAGSSAVRAGLMAVLALFARATGRQYDALRILTFTFFVMILWNPLQLLYDPGFQFSFAATLGLIVFTGLLEVRLQKIRYAPLREIVATTLAAQLFVLPLLLYHTGMLSFVSVPANILALPLVPLAMFFSFIAGLVGMLAPALSVWVGLPSYALLTFIIKIAELGASLPLAHITLPSFPFVFVVFAYAVLAFLTQRLKCGSQRQTS